MTAGFDLLGDPIPEGWGRRGRPAHIATDENRNKVIILCAMEWPDDKIAAALGITRPTLRKNYLRELRARIEARARLEAALLAAGVAQAAAGNVGAMKLVFDKLQRLDLLSGEPAKKPKAEKLGKKEMARLKANEPPKAWGDLVH